MKSIARGMINYRAYEEPGLVIHLVYADRLRKFLLSRKTAFPRTRNR